MLCGRVGSSSKLRTVSCFSSKVNVHKWRSNRRELFGGFMISLGNFGVQNKAFAMQANPSQIQKILSEVSWPDEFPLDEKAFGRYDESVDTEFYAAPRFVTHIDDGAIAALTKYYESVFPSSAKDNVAMLDICSSWISHYPKDFKAQRISGMGMNGEELAANPILTDYVVHDLNEDPKLPYEDNTFDFVTNAVSVDYLTKPLQVFQEIHRVLKPGGCAIMSFSNRCFPTKAIAIWTATDDLEHIYIVGAYFHYSVKDGFTKPEAIDITPPKKLLEFGGDPMYVVQAKKQIV